MLLLMETQKDHFSARQVGVIDAVYRLAGWSKHRSSRGTIFISCVYPGHDERRQLRHDIRDLAENDTNIFIRTISKSIKLDIDYFVH